MYWVPVCCSRFQLLSVLASSQVSDSLRKTDSFLWQFRSLQLSLLLCSFVAVIGGGFFLATALFIEADRDRAENYVPSGH